VQVRFGLSSGEIRFLEELVRNRVPFMIVGAGAAALQGAPMVTDDIDLWFQDLQHPGITKALATVNGRLLEPLTFGFQSPPMFCGKAVERFDIVVHVHGVEGFRKELGRAIRVQLGTRRIPVMSLQRILRSKMAANREKDRAVIPVLKDVIATVREMRKSRSRGRTAMRERRSVADRRRRPPRSE
jgi:hypothetical protein